MIIETSANQFYKVWSTGDPCLHHVWNGYRVVQNAAGQWVYKVRYPDHPKVELVRKAATRLVDSAEVHFLERA